VLNHHRELCPNGRNVDLLGSIPTPFGMLYSLALPLAGLASCKCWMDQMAGESCLFRENLVGSFVASQTGRHVDYSSLSHKRWEPRFHCECQDTIGSFGHYVPCVIATNILA